MVATYIQALLPASTPRWNAEQPVGTPVTVTYQFLTSLPGYYASTSTESNGFQPLTAGQQAGVINALDQWSQVANITFLPVAEGGQLTFANATLPASAGAWAYYPGPNQGGDVWLNNLYSENLDLTEGTYGFYVTLHEIGHGLGLDHPDEGEVLPPGEDSFQYTVMSYQKHPAMPNLYPANLMLYDIAAIQYLYGANYSHNAGDTVYSWSLDATFLDTIWDGGGIDTIDASQQIRDTVINLNAGQFSSIGAYAGSNATNNLAIAFGVTIENARGGDGNDTIYGNAANNDLLGGAGNDTLSGAEGDDILRGALGNDQLFGEGSNDILYGDEGRDTLAGGSGDDELFAGYDQDTLQGGPGNDVLRGGKSNDGLFGDEDSDRLYGQKGDDTLFGGTGNDLLSGYGFTWGEKDVLTGEDTPGISNPAINDGADRFILGDSSQAYYTGDGFEGYATITDFSDWEGDKLQVFGNASDYQLEFTTFSGIADALDTLITFKNDLIGVVQDTTSVVLPTDFVFV